jgi:hypothetical protein
MTRGRRRTRPGTNHSHGVARPACAPWPAAEGSPELTEMALGAPNKKTTAWGGRGERGEAHREEERSRGGSGKMADAVGRTALRWVSATRWMRGLRARKGAERQ